MKRGGILFPCSETKKIQAGDGVVLVWTGSKYVAEHANGADPHGIALCELRADETIDIRRVTDEDKGAGMRSTEDRVQQMVDVHGNGDAGLYEFAHLVYLTGYADGLPGVAVERIFKADEYDLLIQIMKGKE